MNKTFKYITAITFLFTGIQTFAQKKDENIGTEVVNVVKPYTPTISDAFKVKETPVIDDETNAQKEEIKYKTITLVRFIPKMTSNAINNADGPK